MPAAAPETPVRRFECFGEIEKVLKEVALHVPVIFGADGEKIIEPLSTIIRKYTASQAWGQIALSLSQGMARRELDELLEREIGHEGPLVIDPNASTEEHQVYSSQTAAKLQKDRLVRSNEATGDILTVIYGIESTDLETEKRLLMHRVRMATLTLEQAEEVDTELKSALALHPHLLRRLKTVRRRLQNAHQLGADGMNEDIHGELFLALAALMQMQGDAPMQVIANLVRQLGALPEQFESVSYAPFHQATLPTTELNRPAERLPPPPPLPQLKR